MSLPPPPPPAPPGPPPPPVGGGMPKAPPSGGAGRGALLNAIQKGKPLKKVPESQKRDASGPSVGGGGGKANFLFNLSV